MFKAVAVAVAVAGAFSDDGHESDELAEGSRRVAGLARVCQNFRETFDFGEGVAADSEQEDQTSKDRRDLRDCKATSNPSSVRFE